MGKGRVINCRSHLNTIRILTRLKNEGAKKKWGREGRKKKEKGWNNREKEREKKWGNEEEGWVSEERNLAKSRELIIENFRSPLLIPLKILFAPRGSAEDERVHYSPPLPFSSRWLTIEQKRQQELHGKLLNLKVFNPLLAAALLSLVRFLLNISSNVKFNRWLVIMKTNSRETDRLPARKMLENFPTFPPPPPNLTKAHQIFNKASPE